MVRLYSINVYYKDVKPVQKKAAYELSSFGFFQRSRYVRLHHCDVILSISALCTARPILPISELSGRSTSITMDNSVRVEAEQPGLVPKYYSELWERDQVHSP